MQAIILGAGTVGTWIADLLCRARHSVTVIDTNPEEVRRINAELDVRAIHGSGSQSTVLFQADICGADICLAVTGDDEVNIVAASMAKALGARRAIARVYAPAFRDMSTFDYQQHFNIDRLLSLEQLSATELARSIRNPGSIPLEHFARGQLEVYELTVAIKAPAVGKPLRELTLSHGVRIGSISRQGRRWIAGGEDEIHAGDSISLIGFPKDVAEARAQFAPESTRVPRRNVIIAGGGETGYHLAQSLNKAEYRILILDEDPKRCEHLATLLPSATIVTANANRRSVLEDEGVGKADYFVACTGNDENNIMAGVEARELGAHKVMAVVGRPDYANVVAKLGIDVAVSERDAVARQVMGFMNDGPIISQSQLPEGSIGVYEIEIDEDVPVTKAPLMQLPLSGRCLIAAIMRDGFVRVPTAKDHLRIGDVIVALIDQNTLDSTISLFKVG
ncbi:Trk system potassium uptake protein TrkA [Rosistilla carotiformis]|uniref:Trk system potassium uptake protein TrkA n=1 Tax=Rosistilla carotiformis TaxID=2528017 RepID=A0A518JZP7_9BACT|nr:Trk system potassium transporter TrkA [Rosistilla carotiformis]QDV71026.1 Trk system potassium uptake protein TrkA [Rosistilla carotiformis]